MNETKSVKVDNWGVFFLQKLQNFFNKTDYCDLTLQFQDNSQLKVHRLVLSACTDFFNVLEVQNDVTDDILVMPRDLQADVVVPIVNFMYTGTLEFEVRMYTRLLKTAMEMKMTVLLKLLEAHRRTVDQVQRNLKAKKPILLNKGANAQPQQQQQSYQRNMTTYSRGGTMVSPTVKAKQQQLSSNASNIKVERSPTNVNLSIRSKKVTNMPFVPQNIPEPVQLVARYANTQSVASQRGPSRFECSEETVTSDQFESSFDNISYESKPLITASQIKEEIDADENHQYTVTRYSGGVATTSSGGGSFEELRKGYIGAIKRPASRLSSSPPEKRSNILEDVKEYTEAHRIRKEIVAEEFKDEVDDDYAEDYLNEPSLITDSPYKVQSGSVGVGGKQLKTSMTIKNDQGSVNHAKIISEVLKKYPHLVKNNKNIKLKIMQKGNTSTETIISSPPQQQQSSPPTKSANIVDLPPPPVPTQIIKTPKSTSLLISQQKKQIIQSTQKLPTPPQPSTTATPSMSSTDAAASSVAKPTTGPQPKKIDSKTMHSLIAQGAENMTGPWLCLKCGVRGRPISIPSYKGFRRHLINVHGQKIDSKLCEHCGWKSTRKIELHHHILVTHNIRPPYEIRFPECNDCEYIALDSTSLQRHREESHSLTNKHHCIYCNKTFSNEIQLYNHMRENHKERACEDGVMDFDDTEDEDDYNDKYVLNNEQQHHNLVTSAGSQQNVGGDNKIKILSNISLPAISTISTSQQQSQNVNITLEPSSEAEALSNVASGIATSLRMLDQNTPHDGSVGENDDFGDGVSGEVGDVGDDGDVTARMEEDDNYIEEAMASVHGELSNDKKDTIDDNDDTKFVTESGSTLELTQAQKADLLQQLQDQSGVVMILNEDAFENTEEKTTADNEEAKKQGISVVYSESSSSSLSANKNTRSNVRKLEEKKEIDAKKKLEEKIDDKITEDEKMDDDNDGGGDDNDDDSNEKATDKNITLPKNDEKKSSSAATKKLIEDWSDEEDDDGEDLQNTAAAAVDSKTEKQDSKEKLNVEQQKQESTAGGNKQTKISEHFRAKSKSKSKSPTSDDGAGEGGGDDGNSGKSSPKNDEVTTPKKDTKSDEKISLDKKDKSENKNVKDTTTEKDKKEQKKIDDNETADDDDDKKKQASSSSSATLKKDDKLLETTELISKEEIKTLISDWEDVDEDDEDDEDL